MLRPCQIFAHDTAVVAYTEGMDSHPQDELPSLDALAPADARRAAAAYPLSAHLERLQVAMRTHPAPAFAWLETGVWFVVLLSLFDHLLNRNGTTGTIIWWLTIGPHEIGHLICMPFGTLLMFFGGTFWQVAFWAIVGVVELLVRKRLRLLLWCMALVGHSFINAAVYIGDARSRELPLLFGLGSESHDWYNIFNMLGLLPLDGAFALLARLLGVAITGAAALAGIYFAWVRGTTGIAPQGRKERRE